MKKIMFNDRYGLTQAVLEGKKTMTRRLMTMTLHKKNGKDMTPVVPDDMFIASDGTAHFQVGRNGYMVPKKNQPAFHVGEEIAVAQRYKDCLNYYERQWKALNDPSDWHTPDAILGDAVQETKGWENKMFVRADLMPHRIIVRKVDVQRLQSISDEDCMKEGIMEGEFMNTWDRFYFDEWGDVPNHITFKRPRDAYRNLIDRISGKGTWQRNPWVYVYTFELLR
jgi:hypothetical protein